MTFLLAPPPRRTENSLDLGGWTLKIHGAEALVLRCRTCRDVTWSAPVNAQDIRPVHGAVSRASLSWAWGSRFEQLCLAQGDVQVVFLRGRRRPVIAQTVTWGDVWLATSPMRCTGAVLISPRDAVAADLMKNTSSRAACLWCI